MCCIVGGGDVMLMGRGLWICSEPWRVCVLRVRKGLNADVAPILHIGESGGAKVEYGSMLIMLSEAMLQCCRTKTKECYV
jgi:hypothetical protein